MSYREAFTFKSPKNSSAYVPHPFFNVQEMPSGEFLTNPFGNLPSVSVMPEANFILPPITGSHVSSEEPFAYNTRNQAPDAFENMMLHHSYSFDPMTNLAHQDAAQYQGESQIASEYQAGIFQNQYHSQELSRPSWLLPAAVAITPYSSMSEYQHFSGLVDSCTLPQVRSLLTETNMDICLESDYLDNPEFEPISSQNSFQARFDSNTQELSESIFNSFPLTSRTVGQAQLTVPFTSQNQAFKKNFGNSLSYILNPLREDSNAFSDAPYAFSQQGNSSYSSLENVRDFETGQESPAYTINGFDQTNVDFYNTPRKEKNVYRSPLNGSKRQSGSMISKPTKSKPTKLQLAYIKNTILPTMSQNLRKTDAQSYLPRVSEQISNTNKGTYIAENSTYKSEEAENCYQQAATIQKLRFRSPKLGANTPKIIKKSAGGINHKNMRSALKSYDSGSEGWSLLRLKANNSVSSEKTSEPYPIAQTTGLPNNMGSSDAFVDQYTVDLLKDDNKTEMDASSLAKIFSNEIIDLSSISQMTQPANVSKANELSLVFQEAELFNNDETIGLSPIPQATEPANVVKPIELSLTQQVIELLSSNSSPVPLATDSVKTTETAEPSAQQTINVISDNETIESSPVPQVADITCTSQVVEPFLAGQEIDFIHTEKQTSASVSAKQSAPELKNDKELTQSPSPYIQKEIDSINASFPDLKKYYRLVDRIGKGTFSKVYKAYDIRQSDRFDYTQNQENAAVAIKMIHGISSPQRTANEISCLQDLESSPSVIPLIHALRNGDVTFLVFPLVEHEPFEDFSQKMSLEDFKHYISQLFVGMKHIHAKGIIHRDIKPANFLYDSRTGNGYIGDFGLAQKFTNEDTILPKDRKKTASQLYTAYQDEPHGYFKYDTRSPIRVDRSGTKAYRAPEIYLNSPRQTTAMDIWAIGVIMLSFLTNSFPFFEPEDVADGLVELMSIFGAKKMNEFGEFYGRNIKTNIKNIPKKEIDFDSLCRLFNSKKIEGWPKKDYLLALDLMRQCLKLIDTERISADNALSHPFFQIDVVLENFWSLDGFVSRISLFI